MSLLRFVFRNVRRNVARSVVTALLLLVFMFIFSALAGILASVAEMRSGAEDSLRLGVNQRYVGAWKSELPASYVADTRTIPGVVAASGTRFIGGTVRTEDNFLFGYAIEPSTYRSVWQQLEDPKAVAAGEWTKFAGKRESALVGFRILQKQGWRVGQRVTINTWGNLPDIKFDIVGTLLHRDFADIFVMHRDYMEDTIRDEGKVEMIGVRVASAADQDRAARAIETHFQGRPVQVVVRSEKAFIRNLLDQAGDFFAVFVLLAVVVFVTCFLMTLNSLGMSIRERSSEIALLRAFGFPRAWITRLTTFEAMFLAGTFGTIGAFLAVGFFKMMNIPIPIGFGGSLDIPVSSAIACSVLAFALGGISALLSLRTAFRAPVADVLRKVS